MRDFFWLFPSLRFYNLRRYFLPAVAYWSLNDGMAGRELRLDVVEFRKRWRSSGIVVGLFD